jgi:Zn-finger nucleic acid-binding protein
MGPVDHVGLHLDVCPECAGIWFDRGELVELERSAPEEMDRLDAQFLPELEIVAPAPRRRLCPVCQTALETHRYAYDSPVMIDACPKCGGVFVEDRELQAMHEAVSDELRGRATGAMEARARLTGRPAPAGSARDRETDVAALIHALADWRNRPSEVS